MPRTWTERLDRWHDCATSRPGILLLIAAGATAIQISSLWYATPDSTSYMSIARTMWSPDGPTNLGSRHLYFSIGYPVLISPLFLLSDRPFVGLSFVNWLPTSAVLYGTYRWARSWGPTAALAASALTTVHAIYGISMRRPLSETAFAAAMVWSVNALEFVRAGTTPRRRIVGGVLGTLLLTVACLIRPHGTMLIPGFAVAMLAAAWGDRTREFRAALIVALIGGIASAAFIGTRVVDDRRAEKTDVAYTYWDQLLHPVTSDKSLVARVPEGCLIQLFDWQRCVVPGMYKARSNSGHLWNVNLPIALLVAPFILGGWYYMMRTRGDMWTWTFPFYMALNAAWAADVGTRYTLPIMPVVLTAFWLGLTRLFPSAARWFVPVFVLHLLVGLGGWLFVDRPRNAAINREWDSAAALSRLVDVKQETVARRDLTPEEAQLFRFELDRDVPPLANFKDTRELMPNWLVGRDDGALEPGYRPTASAGRFRLDRREIDALRRVAP